MKYFFEDWLFVKGKRSHCFRRTDASRLSAEDKRRIGIVYQLPSALRVPDSSDVAAESTATPVGMSIEELMAAVSSSPTLVRELQRVRTSRT